MADFHLQVRPGTDAWCVAALVAVLVQEDLVDHAWLADHTTGAARVLDAFRGIDIAGCAAQCGCPKICCELQHAASARRKALPPMKIWVSSKRPTARWSRICRRCCGF